MGWRADSGLGHGNPAAAESYRVAAGHAGGADIDLGNHSLVLTAGGAVFAFGCGEEGRLGHNDEEDYYVPKLVEALRGQRVAQVAAGID